MIVENGTRWRPAAGRDYDNPSGREEGRARTRDGSWPRGRILDMASVCMLLWTSIAHMANSIHASDIESELENATRAPHWVAT